jgi:hypothetical protein
MTPTNFCMLKGAVFGFITSVLIVAVPFLVEPVGKEGPPGFYHSYLEYACGVIIWAIVIGLIVGVPVGAVCGFLFPRRAPNKEVDQSRDSIS